MECTHTHRIPACPGRPSGRRFSTRAALFGIALVSMITACAKSNPGTGNSNNVNNSNPPVDGGDRLPLGMNCSFSRECNSDLCLGVGQELLCSSSCQGDPCPEGFYCAHVDVQIAPSGEDVPPSGYYCLPDRGGLCKPCGSDINCNFAGDRCLDLGNGLKVCGRDCQYDGTCPVGYECRQGQCWPIMNTCDCIPERVGATRACQNMNEFGLCLGVQTCGASEWDACSAQIPSFEVCNGVDDDCDGHLPSEELDTDNNGTIDCIEDCQPTAEVCDSEDNDCNGEVDDGDPVAMCGAVANGEPQCLHGECVVGSCDEGYVDIDGDLSNGCECQLTVTGGETCTLAEVVGPLSDAAGGQSETRTGILQEGQERWYYVQAIDSPDAGPGGCDAFHFRAQITVNPSAVYKIDILGEHCAGDPECPAAITDFQWFTNFRDGADDTATGECPCGDGIQVNENLCTDNTKVYLIRIFRQPGTALTCEPYELEFSNGIYPAPI